jgi:hypothetical protein
MSERLGLLEDGLVHQLLERDGPKRCCRHGRHISAVLGREIGTDLDADALQAAPDLGEV